MELKLVRVNKNKTSSFSTFTNPVLDESVADPTIWKVNKTFYLFYSGWFTCPIYRSDNMIDWASTGKSPFDDHTIEQLKSIAEKYQSDPVIYAPTVIKNGDKYLMYLSITWKALCVLVSDSPEGPFKFRDNTPYVLVDKEISKLNITFEDSCVAQEKNNGQWYLMFGSHGRLMRTTLTDDGLSLKTGKFDHVAGNRLFPRLIYEGLYAYYREGYWYLFAAKGDYTSAKRPYEVVVGRSKSLGGVFRNKIGFRMDLGFATTILKPDSTQKYLGGGHTGEIFIDDDGDSYIYYQRQRANEIHFRPLFLQRIYWGKDGWPYFKDGVTQMRDIKPYLKK